jgi:polyisoprenoid-binding protein YceI
MKLIRSILVFALAITAAPLFADTYTLDKAHPEALFSVRHLMSRVTGKFEDLNATINVDPKNLTGSNVALTIKAASVNTGQPDRDKHLRTADFFDAEQNPDITFRSTLIKLTSKKDVYSVTGDLTIRGVTKRVTLPVTILGFGKDPMGNDKAGFTTTTTINRKDFGVNWNKALDNGGFLVGDDVEITVNIEAYKAKPATASGTAGK